MDFSIRDPDTGEIKTWVWIVGAVGFVAVIAVFVGRGSQLTSSNPDISSGQSSEDTANLAQLNELLKKLIEQNSGDGSGSGSGGDNSNNNTTPTAPSPTTTVPNPVGPPNGPGTPTSLKPRPGTTSGPTPLGGGNVPAAPKPAPLPPLKALKIPPTTKGTSYVSGTVGTQPKVNPTNPR